MDTEELKVSVEDLKVGMYVCRLDRPWLESPFLFQGFPLNTPQAIAEVQAVCDHVFVDVERSSDDVVDRLAQLRELGVRRVLKNSLDHYGELARKSVRRYRSFTRNGDGGDDGNALVLGAGKVYPEDVETEQELGPARQVLETCLRVLRDTFDQVCRTGHLDAGQIVEAVDGVVDSMVRNPDALIWLTRLGDPESYSYRHCINTAIWSVALGRQIGLPRNDLRLLGQGAMCCDLGKAMVPPDILNKTGPLDDDELVEVRSHVQHSLAILEEDQRLDPAVLAMVAQHHEYFDGSGYHQGLSGDAIDLYARVAAIADTFDALINDRVYRHGVPVTEAIREMYQQRGRQFQPELLEEFIHAIGLYPAGTLVELSTGAIGAVIGQSRIRRLRPRVMLLMDADRNRLEHYPIIDLMREDVDSDGQPLHIVRDLKPGAHGLDPVQHFF